MVFALPFPEIGPDLFAVEIGGFRLALWQGAGYRFPKHDDARRGP